MKKIREVVRLRLSCAAGVRQIAAACKIGTGTASQYVAKIESAGLSWPSAGALSEQELLSLLSGKSKSPQAKVSLPDWSLVRGELARKGVTLKLLWSEYRKQEPGGYSYSRYARLYRRWCSQTNLVMLQRHKAGERLFVDWAGMTLGIVDPATGELKPAHVFVAAMGAAQYIFAKAYESEQLRCWLNAHVDAFEFFGALPEIVVRITPRQKSTKLVGTNRR